MQEVAVEKGLALLLQTHHRVQLARRLVGKDRVQEFDVSRRRLHVDEEVGAGERKQRRDRIGRQQQRIDIDLAAHIAQERDRDRHDARAVQEAPDQVGALVAVEQVRQDLDLAVLLDVERPAQRGGGAGGRAMRLADRADHPSDVAFDVDERRCQPDVDHDLAQRVAQARGGRVVAAIGRRVRIHVVGRNTRSHEDERVVEIKPVQQLGAHGIEERLGAFGLAVPRQGCHVLLLDRLPQRIAFLVGQRVQVEVALNASHRVQHALVVEVDPFARRRPHALPVAALEAGLGPLRHVAEAAVVQVESFQDRVGDRGRLRHRAVEACRFGRSFDQHVLRLVDRIGCGPAGRQALMDHEVSPKYSRPISIRRISDVPAPISYSLASRHSRPVEKSLM